MLQNNNRLKGTLSNRWLPCKRAPMIAGTDSRPIHGQISKPPMLQKPTAQCTPSPHCPSFLPTSSRHVPMSLGQYARPPRPGTGHRTLDSSGASDTGHFHWDSPSQKDKEKGGR